MKKIFISMLLIVVTSLMGCTPDGSKKSVSTDTKTEMSTTKKEDEVTAGASQSTSADTDVTTSASVVPKEFVKQYKPKGFTDSEKEKFLFVIADPRKDSVTYDLANTAMKHFEEKGMEVMLRDLYDMNFNPVMKGEAFFNAKDGSGETPKDIIPEQEYVSQSDHIIFVYPNWHDTPTPLVKGYMERVFAKNFAYKDTKSGLEGLLKDKDIFTIMNCGYLGGGQGFIGDGIGQNDEIWDRYMKAFKVFDDDTAQFWGVTNKGRFMNDQTPKNNSKTYEKELQKLQDTLTSYVDNIYFD